MAKNLYPAVVFLILTISAQASQLLVPMDTTQTNHLKAYGAVYRILSRGETADLLLNYRGGSFSVSCTPENENEFKAAGVSYQCMADEDYATIIYTINQPTNNMAVTKLDKAPKIAVYTPATENPWDDAVRLALDYSGIPYDKIYDGEVLDGKLSQYDWLHVHHDDFTGQYGKFYSMFSNADWYQQTVADQEKLAAQKGFAKVSKMKLEVCHRIRDFVAGGGYMFAMCSAPESFDMALAAENTDICATVFDHDPVDPQAQAKLDYSQCFAFENWHVNTSAYSYVKSDIDVSFNWRRSSTNDNFNLSAYDAKLDPAEAMLCQNHVQTVKGFLGQSTAFNMSYIKPGVQIMGQNNSATEAKYIHGIYGKGSWTWYPGHDPECYSHPVGSTATDLSKYPNSPGYRLILNNVFLRASEVPVTDNIASGIQLYPNPSSGYVNVTGQTGSPHYLLFDETGKLMQSGTLNDASTQLDIAQFPNGIYLLQVAGGTFKIMKQ